MPVNNAEGNWLIHSWRDDKNLCFIEWMVRSAINSVFHLHAFIQPLCNVIKGPHCMMSSAVALRVLALPGWIPKLWPNLSGMCLTEPVSKRGEREWEGTGGRGCTWEINGLQNRLSFAMGKGWMGGDPGDTGLKGALNGHFSLSCIWLELWNCKWCFCLFVSFLLSPSVYCVYLAEQHCTGIKFQVASKSSEQSNKFSGILVSRGVSAPMSFGLALWDDWFEFI